MYYAYALQYEVLLWYTSISCNIGTNALPDMSAFALGATRPRAGVHIRQSTRACVTTNMLTFQ